MCILYSYVFLDQGIDSNGLFWYWNYALRLRLLILLSTKDITGLKVPGFNFIYINMHIAHSLKRIF